MARINRQVTRHQRGHKARFGKLAGGLACALGVFLPTMIYASAQESTQQSANEPSGTVSVSVQQRLRETGTAQFYDGKEGWNFRLSGTGDPIQVTTDDKGIATADVPLSQTGAVELSAAFDNPPLDDPQSVQVLDKEGAPVNAECRVNDGDAFLLSAGRSQNLTSGGFGYEVSKLSNGDKLSCSFFTDVASLPEEYTEAPAADPVQNDDSMNPETAAELQKINDSFNDSSAQEAASSESQAESMPEQQAAPAEEQAAAVTDEADDLADGAQSADAADVQQAAVTSDQDSSSDEAAAPEDSTSDTSATPEAADTAHPTPRANWSPTYNLSMRLRYVDDYGNPTNDVINPDGWHFNISTHEGGGADCTTSNGSCSGHFGAGNEALGVSIFPSAGGNYGTGWKLKPNMWEGERLCPFGDVGSNTGDEWDDAKVKDECNSRGFTLRTTLPNGRMGWKAPNDWKGWFVADCSGTWYDSKNSNGRVYWDPSGIGWSMSTNLPDSNTNSGRLNNNLYNLQNNTTGIRNIIYYPSAHVQCAFESTHPYAKVHIQKYVYNPSTNLNEVPKQSWSFAPIMGTASSDSSAKSTDSNGRVTFNAKMGHVQIMEREQDGYNVKQWSCSQNGRTISSGTDSTIKMDVTGDDVSCTVINQPKVQRLTIFKTMIDHNGNTINDPSQCTKFSFTFDRTSDGRVTRQSLNTGCQTTVEISNGSPITITEDKLDGWDIVDELENPFECNYTSSGEALGGTHVGYSTTIYPSKGDNVTCHVRNRKQQDKTTKISIRKMVADSNSNDWQPYSGMLFAAEGPNGSDYNTSRTGSGGWVEFTFKNPAQGNWKLTEFKTNDDMTFDHVQCNVSTGSAYNSDMDALHSISAQVTPGQDVECTFYNRRVPPPPAEKAGYVQITKNWEITGDPKYNGRYSWRDAPAGFSAQAQFSVDRGWQNVNWDQSYSLQQLAGRDFHLDDSLGISENVSLPSGCSLTKAVMEYAPGHPNLNSTGWQTGGYWNQFTSGMNSFGLTNHVTCTPTVAPAGKGTLSITKTWKEPNGTIINGGGSINVTVGADGYNQTKSINGNGSVVFSDVPEGSVQVSESVTSVPTGYTLTGSSVDGYSGTTGKATVVKGQTTGVNIVNLASKNAPTSISISASKEWVITGNHPVYKPGTWDGNSDIGKKLGGNARIGFGDNPTSWHNMAWGQGASYTLGSAGGARVYVGESLGLTDQLPAGCTWSRPDGTNTSKVTNGVSQQQVSFDATKGSSTRWDGVGMSVPFKITNYIECQASASTGTLTVSKQWKDTAGNGIAGGSVIVNVSGNGYNQSQVINGSSTATFTNVPAGQVTVLEAGSTAPDGYDHTGTTVNGKDGSVATATVSGGGASTVNIVNVASKKAPNSVTVSVNKKWVVTGDMYPAGTYDASSAVGQKLGGFAYVSGAASDNVISGTWTKVPWGSSISLPLGSDGKVLAHFSEDTTLPTGCSWALDSKGNSTDITVQGSSTVSVDPRTTHVHQTIAKDSTADYVNHVECNAPVTTGTLTVSKTWKQSGTNTTLSGGSVIVNVSANGYSQSHVINGSTSTKFENVPAGNVTVTETSYTAPDNYDYKGTTVAGKAGLTATAVVKTGENTSVSIINEATGRVPANGCDDVTFKPSLTTLDVGNASNLNIKVSGGAKLASGTNITADKTSGLDTSGSWGTNGVWTLPSSMIGADNAGPSTRYTAAGTVNFTANVVLSNGLTCPKKASVTWKEPTPTFGSVTVEKKWTDASGNAIADTGARVKVTLSQGSWSQVKEITGNGTANFSSVPTGPVTVKETDITAPNGYDYKSTTIDGTSGAETTVIITAGSHTVKIANRADKQSVEPVPVCPPSGHSAITASVNEQVTGLNVTLTAKIVDAAGKPIPGVFVMYNATGDQPKDADRKGVTDNNGEVQWRVTSSQVSKVTYTLRIIGGTGYSQSYNCDTVQVNWVAPGEQLDCDASRFYASPASTEAGSAVTMDVQARGAGNVSVPAAVTIATSDGKYTNLSWDSAWSGNTDQYGNAKPQVSSSQAQTKTFQATITAGGKSCTLKTNATWTKAKPAKVTVVKKWTIGGKVVAENVGSSVHVGTTTFGDDGSVPFGAYVEVDPKTSLKVWESAATIPSDYAKEYELDSVIIDGQSVTPNIGGSISYVAPAQGNSATIVVENKLVKKPLSTITVKVSKKWVDENGNTISNDDASVKVALSSGAYSQSKEIAGNGSTQFYEVPTGEVLVTESDIKAPKDYDYQNTQIGNKNGTSATVQISAGSNEIQIVNHAAKKSPSKLGINVQKTWVITGNSKVYPAGTWDYKSETGLKLGGNALVRAKRDAGVPTPWSDVAWGGTLALDRDSNNQTHVEMREKVGLPAECEWAPNDKGKTTSVELEGINGASWFDARTDGAASWGPLSGADSYKFKYTNFIECNDTAAVTVQKTWTSEDPSFDASKAKIDVTINDGSSTQTKSIDGSGKVTFLNVRPGSVTVTESNIVLPDGWKLGSPSVGGKPGMSNTVVVSAGQTATVQAVNTAVRSEPETECKVVIDPTAAVPVGGTAPINAYFENKANGDRLSGVVASLDPVDVGPSYEGPDYLWPGADSTGPSGAAKWTATHDKEGTYQFKVTGTLGSQSCTGFGSVKFEDIPSSLVIHKSWDVNDGQVVLDYTQAKAQGLDSAYTMMPVPANGTPAVEHKFEEYVPVSANSKYQIREKADQITWNGEDLAKSGCTLQKRELTSVDGQNVNTELTDTAYVPLATGSGDVTEAVVTNYLSCPQVQMNVDWKFKDADGSIVDLGSNNEYENAAERDEVFGQTWRAVPSAETSIAKQAVLDKATQFAANHIQWGEKASADSASRLYLKDRPLTVDVDNSVDQDSEGSSECSLESSALTQINGANVAGAHDFLADGSYGTKVTPGSDNVNVFQVVNTISCPTPEPEVGTLSWQKVDGSRPDMNLPDSKWLIEGTGDQEGFSLTVTDCVADGECALPGEGDEDSAAGRFKVTLPAGTYRIKELEAPLGYEKGSEVYDVTVTNGEDSAVQTELGDGKIPNRRIDVSVALPFTGEKGMVLILLAGGLTLALAAYAMRRNGGDTITI